VRARPAKLAGYRVLIRKSSIEMGGVPIPWASVQSLFPSLEGARSHLRKLIIDHVMICEKAGVGSLYDIAIQAVKDDGASETVESVGLSIDVGSLIP
jgi:hypothetical protein